MRTGAGLSRDPDSGTAAAEAAMQAAEGLEGHPARIVVVFATPAHLSGLEQVAETVAQRLAPQALVGGVAQGVVGPGAEVEEGTALSVWATTFEGGEVHPFHSAVTPLPEGGLAVTGWPETDDGDVILLLADPFSFPAPEVVAEVGQGRPIVGGLITGGQGASALIEGGDVHGEGAVGVVLEGGVVDTLVSQGCRPVGSPFVVTAAEENVLKELGGMPAGQRLREVYEEADPEDQRLLAEGVHLGVVADEYRPEFGTGDFLIRAVLGLDDESGGLVVGDQLELGQTVQFQVRDASSAHDELDRMLERGDGAGGALLFTCNGRGLKFFGEPDHDVSLVERHLKAPVAGAFCAGEIGPVGPRSFLHGWTASLALFQEPEAG